MARLCVLTPAADYTENWSLQEADYRRLFGNDLIFRAWNAPGDLSQFAIVSPLIAWGYQRDCPHWLGLLDTLAASQVRMCNPVSVLRWNTDKAYLGDLADAGIATVATRMTHALCDADLNIARAEFSTDILVIKPPVSGGADGTFRLSLNDPIPESAAEKRMMIQPYQSSIAREGEYSLFYFDGQFSHAIIKRPAVGDFRVQDQFGGSEKAVFAPEGAKSLAQSTLIATSRITATCPLTYARVDMVRDSENSFRLMELELIEPSLFLQFAEDKGAAFAHAFMRGYGT